MLLGVCERNQSLAHFIYVNSSIQDGAGEGEIRRDSFFLAHIHVVVIGVGGAGSGKKVAMRL